MKWSRSRTMRPAPVTRWRNQGQNPTPILDAGIWAPCCIAICAMTRSLSLLEQVAHRYHGANEHPHSHHEGRPEHRLLVAEAEVEVEQDEPEAVHGMEGHHPQQARVQHQEERLIEDAKEIVQPFFPPHGVPQ